MPSLSPFLHRLTAHLTGIFGPVSTPSQRAKWLLYALSLLLALLIPALSPANCVMQRVFNVESWADDGNVYFKPATVVDVLYVLWLGAFGGFASLEVAAGRAPWGLRVLHYIFACTLPMYLFGTLGIWVGRAKEDYGNDYFHAWLAPSLTMGVVVGRVMEYLVPERVGEGGAVLGKAGSEEAGKGGEEVRLETVEYPSRWMCRWVKGEE